ncbi:MAG: ATP-binding cassette domain-containing protein, partial [Candidatus Lokiarchaeota archaeon]|nr:ATP-binding cassette domain-containing protein [Candidatus Lokiarchaeota archaeon]
ISDVSISIDSGEFILITGASGSGKSTLIRTFNGLIPHFYGGTYEGTIKVLGMDPVESETRKFADKVGIVFQNPDNQLFMTDVESEIAFGLENMQFSERKMNERIEETLESLGISSLKNRIIGNLSGGEKQKVAIASVLAMHPKILVLDEPTSELDPKAARDILRLLQKMNDKLGITIIVVEHRLERVLPYVDRVIVLRTSKIFLDDTPENIFSNGKIDKKQNGYLKHVNVPDLVLLHYKLKDRFEKELRGVRPATSVRDAYNKLGFFINNLEFTTPTIHSRNLLNRKNLVIDIENLNFDYPDKKDVLNGISLKVSKGEFLAVVGVNGSGKSTLLKHLNGLLKPKSGSVLINGISTKKTTVSKMSNHVGLMFQNPSIQFYRDTVEAELSAIVYNYIDDLNDIPKRVNDMLKLFELEPYRDTYPRYLSLGEQQKTSMAAALISKPEILALDEPTHGLDYVQKLRLFQFLADYTKKGNVVITASHDIDTISKFADRVVLIDEGRIILDGDPRETLPATRNFQPSITRFAKMFPNVPDNIVTIDQFMDSIITSLLEE